MRFRLEPSSEQAAVLAVHCEHARKVWNLAVEQQNDWRPGRASAPGRAEQMRQLTEARKDNDWLRAGSSVVQQQALNDFDIAMKAFFAQPTKRKPTWRKKRLNEGFRIVDVGGTRYAG